MPTRSRRLLTSALVLTTLSPAAVLAAPGSTSATAAPAARASTAAVTFVSYNIRTADAKDAHSRKNPHGDPLSWRRRAPYAVKAVTDQHPDVVGLNEVRTYNKIKDPTTGTKVGSQIYLRRAFAKAGYAALNWTNPPTDPKVAERPKMIFVNTATITHLASRVAAYAGGGSCNKGRSAALAALQVKATGTIFYAVNTHLSAGRKCAPVRESQARQLHAMIQTFASDTYGVRPLVVSGDLNVAPDDREQTLSILTSEVGAPVPYKLKARPTLDESREGTVNRGWRDAADGDRFPHSADPNRFDYVLASSDVSNVKKSYRVVTTTVPGSPYTPSDHYPISMTLRIPV